MDFQDHECELLTSPNSGHPIVVIIGGQNGNGTGISNIHAWDTITDELIKLNHKIPFESDCLSSPWVDMDVTKYNDESLIVSGGICGGAEISEIYSYSMKDGFFKLGEMMVDRKDHSTIIVWDDEKFKCIGKFDLHKDERSCL